jgi:hypothetical protein
LRELQQLHNQTKYFLDWQVKYKTAVHLLYKELDFQIVVYDEAEQFKDSSSDQFDYPYTKRKSVIHSFDHFNILKMKTNYEIWIQEIMWQKSETCL